MKARRQNVWTEDNIVKSPYVDVEIPDITLPEYIWRNIENWVDKTAMVCGITDRSYTYRELYDYSQNFAATLRSQLHIQDGDVVGLMTYNSIEYPIALMGAIQAGAIVTTFSPAFTTNEVHRQLLLAKPKLMIGSLETIGVIKEAIYLTETSIPIIIADNFEVDALPGTLSFADLFNNNKIDKNILNEVRRKPEDVIFLLYSSGTTGLPKGVELTNRNQVANFIQQEAEGLKHFKDTTGEYQDSVLVVIPLYHSYGLSISLLHNLTIGAKIVVIPKFQRKTFLNALKDHKISLLYSAPPLFQFLCTHPDVTKDHLTTLERIVCGAAPLTTSYIKNLLCKAQPNLQIIQAYGLTEVSPFATSMVPGSRDYATIGVALPNTELRVVDSSDRNLGPDEVGELHIRGPQVMKGYKDNPEATMNAITEDKWFRTGDLATINNDGIVTLVGRMKELIKVKGYQVAPTELEDILKEHPDIKDAAVVGIPDERKGEVPKAFVVLKDGYKTTATNLINFVNTKVAEYKMLKEVEFLDDLPKNLAGKLLRRVLLEKYC
ncbi:uncharacterized protein [Epargyreus clarus]|uniref:uncharacterized protein isoform X1 n=1 Tax=Epargyreus clarus TaxID=520877 RepID=UPI003C2EBD77